MFDRLIESGTRVSRLGLLPSGAVACLAHLALGAAAVLTTLQPEFVAHAAALPVVLSWPKESGHRARPGPPESIDASIPPIPAVLTDPSIGIPPVDPGASFDPAQWLRAVDDAAYGSAPGTDPSGPWSAALVEEQPALLAAPELLYPEPLRRAGIAGRVIVEAVIDTLGRAEPRSVRLIQSPHPGFDSPARGYIRHALFRPARVRGRAVRVLIRLPIDFRIGG